MKALTKGLITCTILFIMVGCNPVKNHISTIREKHHIPQQREWLKNSNISDVIVRLWTDLYLEDSTIVFVHKQSDDFYVNGLWGDDYNELIEMLETEYFLKAGAKELKELFEDVDISSYKVRRILQDHVGNNVYSLEFEVADLQGGEDHQISFQRLERLMKLTEGLYPIHTLEGVSINSATWNEVTGGIDFSVNVNRRPYSKSYYSYDETAFKKYIDNNWFDLVYGFSYIITLNGIPVTFNVNNNGVNSSISYDYQDYQIFIQERLSKSDASTKQRR